MQRIIMKSQNKNFSGNFMLNPNKSGLTFEVTKTVAEILRLFSDTAIKFV